MRKKIYIPKEPAPGHNAANYLSAPVVKYEGKRPCAYTVEEMKGKLRQSEEEIKMGRVIPMDDLMKEWDTW